MLNKNFKKVFSLSAVSPLQKCFSLLRFGRLSSMHNWTKTSILFYQMLVRTAYHPFLNLIVKFPSPVAKYLLYLLIYRLKMLLGTDKTGIYRRNQWIIKHYRGVVKINQCVIKTLRFADKNGGEHEANRLVTKMTDYVIWSVS